MAAKGFGLATPGADISQGGALALALAAALPNIIPPVVPPGEVPLVIGENVAWRKGPYTVYNSPFNSGGVVRTNTTTFLASTFPVGAVIAWNYPLDGYQGIRGFDAIDIWNDYNTAPIESIAPTKVNAIGTLSATHNLARSGDGQNFDVIYDFWLTKTAGDFTSTATTGRMFEIEVFLHTPDYSRYYVNASGNTQVGTYTDASGRAWKVAVDPTANAGKGVNGAAIPDILFMPADQSDVMNATIDLLAMLAWLKTKGVITGEEFFNGLAMGVEAQQGAGTLTVNALSAAFAASIVPSNVVTFNGDPVTFNGDYVTYGAAA